MNKDPLNEENFILFCAKHYNASLCASTAEFEEDLNRIKYIRKLITRYIESGTLKENLILNHIIILNNVFPPEICSKILIFKLFDQAKYIKPFLIFLNIFPRYIYNIGDKSILDCDEIKMDLGIIEVLRKI